MQFTLCGWGSEMCEVTANLACTLDEGEISEYRIWGCCPFLSLVMKLLSYTGCPRRNVPAFGRVFLRSNYTDITQNTYTQS